MKRFAGKVAIVTGGATSIGAAIVTAFHAAGADVAIADIDEPAGSALAAALGPGVLFRRTDVGAIARQMMTIAEAGLKRRGVLNGEGRDERIYLGKLRRIVDSGVTAADDLLTQFNGPWRKDITQVFNALKY